MVIVVCSSHTRSLLTLLFSMSLNLFFLCCILLVLSNCWYFLFWSLCHCCDCFCLLLHVWCGPQEEQLMSTAAAHGDSNQIKSNQSQCFRWDLHQLVPSKMYDMKHINEMQIEKIISCTLWFHTLHCVRVCCLWNWVCMQVCCLQWGWRSSAGGPT